MNSELLEALNVLEKEKNISKDTLLEAIEQSLLQACKNHRIRTYRYHECQERDPSENP